MTKDNKIPVFDAVPRGDGVVCVALVHDPAHESNFEAFEAQKYRFADAKKQVITGALIIPDKLIYRVDGAGNPFFVRFSAEAIEFSAMQFHKNKFTDKTNESHTDKELEGVYMFESVLLKSAEQIEHYKKMGLGELPLGTWVGSYKVENLETFGKIERGELRGFSVEMYMDLKPVQMAAQRVADVGIETMMEFYQAMAEVEMMYVPPRAIRNSGFIFDSIEDAYNNN